MDDIGAVIYVGTFSKTLFPGMRTGYFATKNKKYLAELTQIMEELKIQVPTLTQFIIAKFVSSGEMDRHVEQTLIPAYSKKAKAMKEALQEFIVDKYEGGVSFTGGDGGLFVWLEILSGWGIDLDYLLDNVAVEGVGVDGKEVIFAYVPGASFTKDGSSENGVRLCFSTESIERMKEAIQAFARMLEEYKH
jgi:2-aminoadipate transaminase